MVENWLLTSQSRRLETKRCWSDVPPELLSLIMSQLFLRDRCNFKLVCKSWSLIIPVTPPLPPPVDYHFDWPCLMYPLVSSLSWKLFHSLYNDFFHLDFPELKDAEICFSKYGWLLMYRDECHLFFFNPFTKVKFELPPTTSSFFAVCFTSPPTSSDCFIFGIFSTSHVSKTEFGLIKFGDHEWKSGWLDNATYKFLPPICPPLFHNGIYYCLEYKSRNIKIFDSTKEDESRWIYFCKCKEEEYKEEEEEEEEDGEEEVIQESYMMEVEGEIWGVFVTNDDRQVSVEKLDLLEMRWSKLESLKDKCLYVSSNGSFAATCTIKDMANKIYFNKFYEKSNIMYSLSSRMYHSVVGNFASKEGYGLRQVVRGAWIKPC